MKKSWKSFVNPIFFTIFAFDSDPHRPKSEPEEKIEKEMMKNVLTCLLAMFGLTSACSQKNYEDTGVKEFAELIADPNVVILDVRTAEEYEEGHIHGAINIDQYPDDFVQKAKAALPTDKTIAIYCRSGRRSAHAATLLAAEGYKCVNLKGGIIAWSSANMPVTKGK